jgi:hypothetical protein
MNMVALLILYIRTRRGSLWAGRQGGLMAAFARALHCHPRLMAVATASAAAAALSRCCWACAAACTAYLRAAEGEDATLAM